MAVPGVSGAAGDCEDCAAGVTSISITPSISRMLCSTRACDGVGQESVGGVYVQVLRVGRVTACRHKRCWVKADDAAAHKLVTV